MEEMLFSHEISSGWQKREEHLAVALSPRSLVPSYDWRRVEGQQTAAPSPDAKRFRARSLDRSSQESKAVLQASLCQTPQRIEPLLI